MIVRRILQYSVEAEFVVGDQRGKTILLPRIPLTPSETALGVKLVRRQFPFPLAFVMTINKAQGQTLEKLGMYLMRRVFSHGQLYVGLSRVGAPSDISCCPGLDADPGNMIAKDGHYYTKNVVFRWNE